LGRRQSYTGIPRANDASGNNIGNFIRGEMYMIPPLLGWDSRVDAVDAGFVKANQNVFIPTPIARGREGNVNIARPIRVARPDQIVAGRQILQFGQTTNITRGTLLDVNWSNPEAWWRRPPPLGGGEANYTFIQAGRLRHKLFMNIPTRAGDSGGPIFVEEPDSNILYLIGILDGTWQPQDGRHGQFATRIDRIIARQTYTTFSMFPQFPVPGLNVTVYCIDVHNLDFSINHTTREATVLGITEGRSSWTHNIRIPRFYRGYYVRHIAANVFNGHSILQTICLPDTLHTIGNGAFAGTDISNIIIPNSVTTIGSHAFAGTDIQNITIPASVSTIGDYAFASMASLAAINMLGAVPPVINCTVFSGVN